MAQSWESPAIRKAGEKWQKAYKKGDKAGMKAAADEAARIRLKEEGYTLSGGVANAKPQVIDEKKFSDTKTGGFLGIGAKTNEERYNSYAKTVNTIAANSNVKKVTPQTKTVGNSRKKVVSAQGNIHKTNNSLVTVDQTPYKYLLPEKATVKDADRAVANMNTAVSNPQAALTAAKEREADLKERRGTVGDWAKNNFFAGVSSFNRGGTATLDFLIPSELIFGEENDPISKLAETYKSENEKWTQAANRINEARGGWWDAGGKVGQAAVQALPSAALAMMSGGSSLAANAAPTLLNGAGAAGTSIVQTLSNSLKTLSKNPLFWSSAAQTLGTDYEHAKETGANEVEATATALISTLLNAAVEVSGGIETLLPGLKNGSRSAVQQWVRSSLEEGREEVVQGVISNLTQKVIYDKDKSLYSLNDPAAIINPKRAAQEFGLGTAAGAILGGGQIGTARVLNGPAATTQKIPIVQPDGSIKYVNEPAPNPITPANKQSPYRVGAQENASVLMRGKQNQPPLQPAPLGTQNNIQQAETVTRELPPNMNEKSAKFIENVKKWSGINVQFADLPLGVEGVYQNGTITISKTAKNPVEQIMKHELTHHMENSGLYQSYADFIMKNVRKSGENVDEVMKQIGRDYQRAGKLLTVEEVRREFVAKYSEEYLFNDEKSIQRLARENPNLFVRIYDWIRDMAKKINPATNAEGRFIIEAQRRYERAIRSVETTMNRPAQNSISYDKDNTPFVVVENDILNGVPKEQWASTVRRNLAAKFKDGVDVGNNTIKINSITRSELLNSKYTKRLGRMYPEIYKDKLRATDNMDEIVSASKDYVGEAKNHPRKDNIKEFARGKVKLRIGGRDYTADVVVGTTTADKMVLYDVLHIQPSKIETKDALTDTGQLNKSENRRQRTSLDNSIIAPTGNVNTKPQNNQTAMQFAFEQAKHEKKSFGRSISEISPTLDARMGQARIKGKPIEKLEWNSVKQFREETQRMAQAQKTPEPKPSDATLNRTKRADDYQKRAENKFEKRIVEILGINKFADRAGVKTAIHEAMEKAKGKNLTQQEKTDLFERMFEEGVIQNDEYLRQYQPLKDYLRTTSIRVTDQARKNIPDYNAFRQSVFGSLRLGNNGVDIESMYAELQEEHPGLFPELNAPGEQLQKIAEVAKGIRQTEETLDKALGPDGDQIHSQMKQEFLKEINKLQQEGNQIRRYNEETQEEAQKEKPLSLEEVKRISRDTKSLQKHVEKLEREILLTKREKIILSRLLNDEINMQDISREPNKEAILRLYGAKRQLKIKTDAIKNYAEANKQRYRDQAREMLEQSDTFKDKELLGGLRYARETPERNLIDIAGEKNGKKLADAYIAPIHKNEAASNVKKNALREEIRNLHISTKKVYDPNRLGIKIEGMDLDEKISESALVQLYGEEKIGADQLRAAGLNEAQVRKVKESVKVFRKTYNGLLEQMNDVLLENGYAPTDYRGKYFPHFEDRKTDGLLSKIAAKIGIEVNVDELPTDIAGLTHTFRPGKKWFRHENQRQGDSTVYDAVRGFDMYLEGIADVIYHTEDIQKLRALENELRYKYSDTGTQEEINEIRRSDETDMDKQSKLDDIYKRDTGEMSQFARWIRSYTDGIAGKKSFADRESEDKLGRIIYNVSKEAESRVAANMVALNPASWLTNFIPLTQGSEVSMHSTNRAFTDTFKNILQKDGFTERSDFMVNRRGSELLWRKPVEKVSRTLSSPMQQIDLFTTEVLTRAKYYDMLDKGVTPDEAMKVADQFTASVVADRSKGALPTIFNERNPLTKLFTVFQVEVNNQLSYLFKDLPRNVAEDGVKKLASALFRYMIGAYIYNDLYEKVIGRRPALDPIGMMNDYVGDLTGYKLPNTATAVQNLITGKPIDLSTGQPGSAIKAVGGLEKNIAENIPFLGGFAGGGRLPISSALPDPLKLRDAITGGMSGEIPTPKALNTAGKELLKPAFYFLPPVGGGQLKKVWDTGNVLARGGNYGMDSQGNKMLKYPVEPTVGNILRGTLFGPQSTSEAREYSERGYKDLNARQTKTVERAKVLYERNPRDFVRAYNEMRINGIKRKEDIARYLKKEGFGIYEINMVLQQKNMKPLEQYEFREIN